MCRKVTPPMLHINSLERKNFFLVFSFVSLYSNRAFKPKYTQTIWTTDIFFYIRIEQNELQRAIYSDQQKSFCNQI